MPVVLLHESMTQIQIRLEMDDDVIALLKSSVTVSFIEIKRAMPKVFFQSALHLMPC